MAVLLAGCATASLPPAGTSAPGTSAAATPTPTPTPTPEVPKAAAFVVGLDAVAIVDTKGAVMQSANFAEPDALVALVGTVMGSTPDPTTSPKTGGKTYQWAGVTVITQYSTSFIHLSQADLAGLTVRTPEGITVGSARSDVVALSAYDIPYDGDGDGKSDSLGIEQRTEPQYDSLTHPGDPGTSFVQVNFVGDTVSGFISPAGDFYDL